MRHAKSDWQQQDQADHDRPLNPRGRHDAPRMAQWVADAGLVPDQVLCSSALRTRETISLMNACWPAPCPVSYEQALYLATPESILQVIRGGAIGAATVMVLGHNPGISQLAALLSGVGVDLPTAAVAVLDCPIGDWSELRLSGDARLIQTIRPKAL